MKNKKLKDKIKELEDSDYTLMDLREDESTSYAHIVSFSNGVRFRLQNVSEKNLAILKTIQDRHEPPLANDPYKRIDISVYLASKDENFAKKYWPKLPTIVSNDNTVQAYMTMLDRQIDQYHQMHISDDLPDMQALKQLPVIDISRFKTDILYKDPNTLRDISFDMYTCGSDFFLPMYPTYILKSNETIWFIHNNTSTKDHIHIRISCLRGDPWLLTVAFDLIMDFEKPNDTKLPCNIRIENCVTYEEFLTDLQNMPWDQKQACLWISAFDIPFDWSNCKIATLVGDDKSEENIEILIYNSIEEKALKSLFGQAVSFSNGQVLQDRLRDMMLHTDVISFLKDMYAAYISLYPNANQYEVTQKNNLWQLYMGKTKITAPEKKDIEKIIALHQRIKNH